MISIVQQPFQITPSNTEHVYTFSSNNFSNTDFRFVIDVYVDVDTTPIKIARQLVSPNSHGRAVINVQRIIENYVEGNARCEDAQYTSENTSDTTYYGILSNLSGVTTSNGYNSYEDYVAKYGVRNYRLLVGEQWLTSTGTTTNIATNASTPGSVISFQLSTETAGYGGSPNTVNWYGAGANIPYGSSLTKGVYYQHTNNAQTIVRASGNTTTPNGSYTPASAPGVDDLLYVTERYSNIRYRYGWFVELPSFQGWALIGIDYPSDEYDPVLSPPQITIWPGTTLYEGSYVTAAPNNLYWNTGEPQGQERYYELFNYRVTGATLTEENPQRFLTTAGSELFSFNDSTAGNVYRARRRKHHPSCPMLVSYFNGRLSNTADVDFNNILEQVTTLVSTDQDVDYQYSGFTEYSNGTLYSRTLTPVDERIKYCNIIRPDLAGGKVAFWAGNSGEFGQWDAADYHTEFLEYYLEEDNCLSDPVHILFLNRQGVFDTYTFDRKAVEQKSIERKTYAQGGIKDKAFYNQLSTERRNVIYDQNITEEMQVETWYLEDNDKQIVMDIFQSPEIYIIKDHNWTGKTEKSYNPYLLPVTLMADSITEFKNRYNKVFQYSFSFEYTPINYYRTQG